MGFNLHFSGNESKIKWLAKEYQRKLVTADEAVKVVKSGDWVEYGSFSCQAVALDRALAARKKELKDVKIRSICRIGIPETVKVDPTAEHFIYNNWHFSGTDRKLHDQGLCWHIPLLYHEVPRYYRENIAVDVVMISVAPMDEHGYFNFGPAVSHTMAMCDRAKIIILEVNPNIPKCLGGREEGIHISKIDYIVEADWSMPQLQSSVSNEITHKIASQVMQEIENGSCIQLGIGGLPNTIGQMIAHSDLKDLGIHTEMFGDSMVDMVQAGRVSGKRKNLDKHKIVYTFALGTEKTYEFIHNNQMCSIYPVDYVNDPFIISQNDNVVSINNCIEMDLFGQVASESSGTRQISGTGGQPDWIYGAYRSQGGKAFICMESTFEKEGKKVSRIKPMLTPGAIVTTHRAMTSYVVTEFGMVNLKGMSTWERAEALISIAHPDFRHQLIKEAEVMGIWRLSNKIL